MIKKGVVFLFILVLLFSFSVNFIDAVKSGSCSNPSGGNYCNGKSNSECHCDAACDKYGDCCDDYKQICDALAKTSTIVSTKSASSQQATVTASPIVAIVGQMITVSFTNPSPTPTD